MLSNACKYAIRAMIYLAIHTDETKKIGVKIIAEDLETPYAFLAKLLQKLASDKLISSAKGPRGGFYLNDTDKKRAIWDVVKCIDGTEKFEGCFLGLSKCNDINPCPVHHIVSPFKKSILKDFRDKSIHDLVREIKENGTVISLKGFDI
ncbi:Rrf2 family transcriptional regulator [Aquimarina sp. I32.4]|uniref:RrF2 family transcriptional regulator n=1 Tax=Aquimarina sp. I32.4 TaxID=2053903 RepID=UPI000CDE7E8F|nr:Rrf2 family transcriptional regulator [Aquimarina sp. I32.4]